MGADSAPAVRCRGVVKIYGTGESQVTALQGVDLDVGTGKLMMLVGPSGCGKTTLISVMAGILDQTFGECHVFGNEMLQLPARAKLAFRAKNIGFVFQAYNLLPTLTAAENVSIPLLINGMNRVEAVKKATDLLGRVGLGGRAKSLPATLSGGQQQRVAIARAIIHNPRLVVCDEPTSALDHDTGHKVMELLKEMAVGENRTLVIVTHDARIFGFADRIAQMDDGRVVRVVNSASELN